ncbi:hypothetical protein H0A36_26160 [Endozoicomonas sp. SM1973]|uniref:Uncharacterized protein n=1 Tax=Spartinivicinus marinus TaxID=2994442 RepID=A0A853INS3_9GAMM|nr:hypothetical protein [Spartinivicinus marinus]MCX4026826.1 hypothetical protein [Spartinivicinus marinus]MCX4028074.1 hypothetical protein [Spartinivicinus marinus]MCX4028837.1 hypothetical protein [Spartinivicinus marinus]NYZ69506.1 hypothetical protein [Spartinivicinus marinus]
MTEAATPTESPLTLEAVQAKFEAWRQRPGKRQPFPKAYWRDVIALQEYYKISKILSTLRISHAQLRVQEQRLNGKAKSTERAVPPANEFIKVDFSGETAKSSATESCLPETLSVELTRPDGTVLKVSAISSQAVDALITRFIA